MILIFFQDENTYLSHVHCTLYEIGMKACLYYHLCCVGVDVLPESVVSVIDDKEKKNSSQKFTKSVGLRPTQRSHSDPNIGAHGKAFLASREEKKTAFFKKLDLHKHDIEIIEVKTL